MNWQTLILGGGLAGIAAAVRLAEWGRPVTLIETSRRLGGRASSHEDPASGEMIDNCQHVVMGCCTNLLDLYNRLGVADRIEWHPRLHFFDKQGHHDVLKAGPLPTPLHLSLGMLGFRTLSLGDKTAIARLMLSMLRLGPQARAKLDGVSFGQWLTEYRQTPGAVDRFWTPIIVSALNLEPAQASAAAAIHVFQDGFLAHRRAYLMGTSSVPLRQLYDPAIRIIERVGGRVLLGTSVEKILYDGQTVTGVQTDHGSFAADHCISTLPFDRLARVADEALTAADERLAQLDRFTHSPILGIHLWFDRPTVAWPHMIFVDSPLQWVFCKSAETPADRGQYLHGVISAADAWVDRSQDEIIEMATRELAAYAPAVAQAKRVRGKVVKEKRATFRVAPGLDAFRPPTLGRVRNLLLAGDWTATGWPATMEGATRSGYQAAAAVLDLPHACVPDLPKAPLVKLLSLFRAP